MEEEIRILCVDDEPNVLNSLRRLFMDDDYTVLTASSAQEGLLILDHELVQIVISDYRMPNMNGVEFLREVRTKWPDTVRIVLSGYADTASIVSAINEGEIYKFIPKPWNDDELKVTVANAIERYHLFKKNAELTSELLKVNEDLKGLLVENAKLLERKGKMLEASQTLLFSLPVAVMGISNDIVVQCNQAWAEDTGDSWASLGKTVDNALQPEIIEFVNKVKSNGRKTAKIAVNGIEGWLFGSAIETEAGEIDGVMLVFIPGDKL
ncbi:MAG TPA: response regulator [Dissulfurispiraceae bacterium]|nr:response regulator [Dissulfurispiraceae bacterium]